MMQCFCVQGPHVFTSMQNNERHTIDVKYMNDH